ncbi:MAG TPA: low affinity iron permease family protein [Acidimicrobiales bacterium]|nr:low affinity iron permease family protein [Acidimicrobiales bacterium]
MLDGSPEHVASAIARQRSWYSRLAARITHWSGSAWAATGVMVALLVWVATGWLAGFPRWWELCATIGLSFVTLLMLVLIQHTQNHDDQAVQLKLDELIRANINAANAMMRLEDAGQADMARIRQAFNEEVSGR